MNWDAIAVILTIILAWSGLLVSVIKWLLTRAIGMIDQRLKGLENAAEAEQREWRRVEMDLMRLRADLPLHYVRKEDAIRAETVINAKLDALGSQIQILTRNLNGH